MKILFTAPRFHTNQVPIVKGLVEKGHEVRFFVAFEGAIEDHTYCQPLVLKPSRYTVREKRRLSKTKSESDVESIIGGHFIPDFAFLETAFTSFMPDFVICREKTNLTLCVHALCQENGIPCILYDQEPIFTAIQDKKLFIPTKKRNYCNRLFVKIHRITSREQRMLNKMRKMTGFPSVRFSPVKYHCKDTGITLKRDNHSYYVPLVYETTYDIEGKNASASKIRRLLFVGKYREYKDIPLLITALERVKKRNDWHLVMVGQAKNKDEIRFKKDITDRIIRSGLAEKVTVLDEISYADMPEVYMSSDLLILPSRHETYGMVIVEAMAHGLAVICSDACGAAFCNAESGGQVFKQGDADSLAKAIESTLNDPSGTEMAGRTSYFYVKNNLSFEKYVDELSLLLKHEFNLLLS